MGDFDLPGQNLLGEIRIFLQKGFDFPGIDAVFHDGTGGKSVLFPQSVGSQGAGYLPLRAAFRSDKTVLREIRGQIAGGKQLFSLGFVAFSDQIVKPFPGKTSLLELLLANPGDYLVPVCTIQLADPVRQLPFPADPVFFPAIHAYALPGGNGIGEGTAFYGFLQGMYFLVRQGMHER